MKDELYKNLTETIQPNIERIDNEAHRKIEVIENDAQEEIRRIKNLQSREIAELVGETFGIKVGQIYQTIKRKKIVITGLSKTTVFYRELRKSDHQPKRNRNADSEKRIIYFLEDQNEGLITLVENEMNETTSKRSGNK